MSTARHLKAVLRERDRTPPRPTAKPAAERKRRPTRHATVGIHPHAKGPDPLTGLPRHRLRWTDPETRKPAEKTITGPRELAERAAIQQHARNVAALSRVTVAATKAEIAGIDARAPKPADGRRRIVDACRAYVAWLHEQPKRSPKTLRHAHAYLLEFSGWCERRAITYLEQLQIEDLESYRAALVAMRQPNGRRYELSTINAQQWPIKAMLNREHERKRAPHLSPVFIGMALEWTKTETRHSARALDVDEIHTCLRAAMAWDWRYRPARVEAMHQRRCLAIDIAMLMLWGFRLAEYTLTPRARAQVDELELAAISVIGKGHGGAPRMRTAYARGFTTIGAALMCELTRDASSAWLSEHDYGQVQNALPLLARHGGVVWAADDAAGTKLHPSAHDFRATCATYQCGVKDLDDSRRCDRLGHDITMAHRVYRQPPRGMVFGAASIEAAMCAEKLFAEVLEHYRQWRDAFGSPRSSKRKEIAPAHSQALLGTGKRADALVADALTAHPLKRHARTRRAVPIDAQA